MPAGHGQGRHPATREDVLLPSVNVADASADTQRPLELITLACAVVEYTRRPPLAKESFWPTVVLTFDLRQSQILWRGGA